MLQGHVRDDFPYILLSLPGRNGSPMTVEFIVDTGFNGDLALPAALLAQTDAVYSFEQDVLMADGSRRSRAHYELNLEWEGNRARRR